jgi:hypothetical protein
LPVIRHPLWTPTNTHRDRPFLPRRNTSKENIEIELACHRRCSVLGANAGHLMESIFRRTLREQHLAQKYKAGTQSDSHVGTMVQVCFYAVHPPIFPLLPTLSFTRETQFLEDSSVQYNSLVASISLRRINGHLPAHGRACGH